MGQRREVDGRKIPTSGPPQKIKIDWKKVNSMLKIQCTCEEICEVLEFSDDTMNDACKDTFGMTFAKFAEGKRRNGHKSLRRKMWEIAMDPDKKSQALMLIWLSKNYLKMTGMPDESDGDRKPFLIKCRDGDMQIGISKSKEEKE